MRKDMNVVFGSGADEEDIDTVEGDRQREQQERMAKIETLLETQEQEFRDERRRKVWGKFSNATTREEVEILEREEALEIAKGTAYFSSSCEVAWHVGLIRFHLIQFGC